MKTRIVKLRNCNKEILLCGAIHIGTNDYFKELNSIADKSDLVLFEGVKATTLDGLKKFYINLGNIIGLAVQNRLGYEDSQKWKNSDMNYEVIKTYMKKNPVSSDKFNRLNELFDELIKDGDQTAIKIVKWIVMFIIKRLVFISKFVKTNFVLVNLRNYNLLVDITKHFEEYNSISVVYGEGHLNDLIKNLKKMNFKVVEVNYLDSFKLYS